MWASAGQVAVLCYAGCASTRVSVTNIMTTVIIDGLGK